MRTLGLNMSGYISSAALAADDEIRAAACEERFSRVKRDRAFPVRSMRFCLAQAGLRLDDIDEICIAWNPGRNLARNLNLLFEANANRGKYLTYVPNALSIAFGGDVGPECAQELHGRRIRYIDHHLAHAAGACLTSPFARCAFVTIDAFGEEDALTLGRYADGQFDVREHVRFPHSIGSFYSYLTEFLGFQADSDEYKVMALGAYADPERGEALRRRLARTYTVDVRAGRLHFELDLARYDFFLFHRPHDFGPLAEVLQLAPRKAGEPLTAEHHALAWALQRCYEDIFATILRHAHASTGERAVAMAGGCLMNSVANGQLSPENGHFEAFHIPPHPDDSGTAVGAALYASLSGRGLGHRFYNHNFHGPDIEPAEVETLCRARKLPFVRVAEPERHVAELVAAGEIVGYAAGRMEFGQRALGHRSIFADPRDPDIRDKVNQHVKQREWFRPYAASVLAERVADIFEAPAGYRVDFMERVRRVRPAWAERIRGLLHADGTIRLHTVERTSNPELHAILVAFEKLTGLPLILNTSFNVNGMPIVCSPADALGCYFACGLDSLVMGGLWLRKSGLPAAPAPRD